MVPSHDQFRPSLVEEDPHVVAGLAHGAVVLVKDLTVVEHQIHVLAELLSQLVPGHKKVRGGVRNVDPN